MLGQIKSNRITLKNFFFFQQKSSLLSVTPNKFYLCENDSTIMSLPSLSTGVKGDEFPLRDGVS